MTLFKVKRQDQLLHFICLIHFFIFEIQIKNPRCCFLFVFCFCFFTFGLYTSTMFIFAAKWAAMLLSYLNFFRSVSVETGKTLSREQSPTSIASQELHRKCHFCSVCKSWTMTLPTYLKRRRLNFRSPFN